MSSDTALEIQKITSTLQFNRTISCKSKAGQREKRGSLVGLTTDEVRGWPRAIEGSNRRPKTHPQNTEHDPTGLLWGTKIKMSQEHIHITLPKRAVVGFKI